jgi:hypothetical protein
MHPITRREMVAGMAVGMAMKPKILFGTQANSSIGLGIIGTGERGKKVGAQMVRDGRARVVAICDIFDDRLDQARKRVRRDSCSAALSAIMHLSRIRT